MLIPMQVDDYFGALKHMALKFRRAHERYEVDELINEIWLSQEFQTMPERGMIWQACQWAMLKYHRSQCRAVNAVPLLDNDKIDDRDAIAKVDARDLLASRMMRLSPREQDIVVGKLAGESYADMQARTGEKITSQGLSARLHRAKRKMRGR